MEPWTGNYINEKKGIDILGGNDKI